MISENVMQKEKKQSLQGLRQFLPQLSKERGWREQLELHSIFPQWQRLLEKDITDHCRPLKIVRKELWIEVENAAWLQQFQYQQVMLLEKLNKSLSTVKLKGLRFVVAEKPLLKEEEDEHVQYAPPPPDEVAAFERQVSSISDEASREALLRFWYLSKACKRGE